MARIILVVRVLRMARLLWVKRYIAITANDPATLPMERVAIMSRPRAMAGNMG